MWKEKKKRCKEQNTQIQNQSFIVEFELKTREEGEWKSTVCEGDREEKGLKQ